MNLKKTIFLLFISNNLLAQNLVSNYSFEDNSFSYPCSNSPTPYFSLLNPPITVFQSDLVSYWNNVSNWTVPEVGIDYNCWGNGSPDCLCDPGFARSGVFYGSNDGEEFMVQMLNQNIVSGELLYYEFYIKGFGGGNFEDVGIKFFKYKPYQCGYNRLKPHPNTPPHLKANNIPKDGLWHKISGYIFSDDDYEWIAIGWYGSESNNAEKVYWDDIKLSKVNSNQCPSQWLFENTTFENENRIYQASDKIVAGEDVDQDNINGPVIVKSNANVIFKAGNQVILEPGFSTESGAYFETVLEPCSPNPCPFIPPPLNDITICDANPVNIGNASPEVGIYYSWSPATYLDNPNSANPVFTPPAGSGIIEYTVTITSICGFFIEYSGFPSAIPNITETVTVNYNSNPNPNPTISITNTQTSDYDFSCDFTVGTDTEEYCIEIYEQGNNQLVYFNCFDVPATSCCNLNFHYYMLTENERANLSICKDYTIKISSRNYCTTNFASDQFDWIRDETNFSLDYVPNVFSMINPYDGYSNGINDEFCVQGTGINTWDFGVFNAAYPGSYFAKFNGVFSNSPQCMWDGFCGTNQGVALSSASGSPAQSGFTYYFILDVVGCDVSQTQTVAGQLNVFWDINPQLEEQIFSADGNQINNETENNEDITSLEIYENKFHIIKIYPNPSTGIFNIEYPIELDSKNIAIKIYDNLGRIILIQNSLPNSFDLSEFSNGIYHLEISTGLNIIRKKIIKQ